MLEESDAHKSFDRQREAWRTATVATRTCAYQTSPKGPGRVPLCDYLDLGLIYHVFWAKGHYFGHVGGPGRAQ